jgi:hypothetical protein
MAKTHGLGWALAVDDAAGTPRTISNDITNLSLATPRAVQDVTGLDKSARETLLLLADMSVELSGVMNTAANMGFQVFKTVSSTSVARTVTNTIAAQTLTAKMLPTDFAHTRSATGEWTYTVPMVLADGVVPVWA